MEKKRKRRKDAHCCENCEFYSSRGFYCECEKESELTEKELTKHWENCEPGCPCFFLHNDYDDYDDIVKLF